MGPNLPTGKIGRKFVPGEKNTPEISSPLENYNELSSPLGKALKFWESPLDLLTVNNRIQNPHPLKQGIFHPHWHFAPSFYPHWLKSSHRVTETGV